MKSSKNNKNHVTTKFRKFNDIVKNIHNKIHRKNKISKQIISNSDNIPPYDIQDRKKSEISAY